MFLKAGALSKLRVLREEHIFKGTRGMQVHCAFRACFRAARARKSITERADEMCAPTTFTVRRAPSHPQRLWYVA
jgi:hypothetical protein